MLIRIVQLCIRSECVDCFLSLFADAAPHIRDLPGCIRLELWKDQAMNGSFATYSLWASAAELEAYRNSELFETNWAAIKPMFGAKPRAFSYFNYDYSDTCSPA